MLLLVITTFGGVFTFVIVSANMYYDINYARLQIAAVIAVKAGALYFTEDPQDAHACYQGVCTGQRSHARRDNSHQGRAG
jgi:hypothetical protein